MSPSSPKWTESYGAALGIVGGERTFAAFQAMVGSADRADACKAMTSRSTRADERARSEDEGPAEDHLERRAQEGRVHEPVLDPYNGPKFEEHHGEGRYRGRPEVGDQVRQRVAQPPDRGHDAGGNPALPRRSAA